MKNTSLLLLFLLSLNLFSQTPMERGLRSINKVNARTYIWTLASDQFEGRRAGHPGGAKGAEYIKEC